MTEKQRLTILMAVTDHDRRQQRTKHYNPYALAQYCAAIQRVKQYTEAGFDLRTAVMGCFLDRLCDKILKALGLELMSKEEARWGVQLPELEGKEAV